ncbi:MAG TPA: hypothetical protein VI893_00045, partial [Thermoplasmata archaeon]|nr:hypothetical protein [Thermoplasmata archaeon]
MSEGNPDTLVRRGAELLSDFRNLEALEYLERALDLDSKSPGGWVLFGRACLRTGRHDDGLYAYEKAI